MRASRHVALVKVTRLVTALVMVTGLVAALLSGCGGNGQAASATTPGRNARAFNPTDVMFLQMMVPHHRQGITIARLVKDRPVRSQVKLLAKAVEATQRAEVRTMAGWLQDWGQPTTAPAASHAAHGGMPDSDPAAIKAVAAASDAEFERPFLNLVIAHQDDAIQMARQELRYGRHPDTLRLARQIERSRTAQISQLLEVLDRG